MRKSIFKGWICRTWTETSLNGWVSEFDRFDTEDEANKHGQAMMRLPFKDGELSREFEVYKDFEEVSA